MAKVKTTTHGPANLPGWAILTSDESRDLYKAEPPRPGMREEEKFLLTFYRKLTQEERDRVFCTQTA